MQLLGHVAVLDQTRAENQERVFCCLTCPQEVHSLPVTQQLQRGFLGLAYSSECDRVQKSFATNRLWTVKVLWTAAVSLQY